MAFAKGEFAGNAAACYRAIYNKDDRAAASRLQHRNDISQRVVEIQSEITASEAAALQHATEALGITKVFVLRKLLHTIEAAEEHEDYNVAVRGLELLGRHVGLFIATSEAIHNHLHVGIEIVDRPERETREQWQQRRLLELALRPGQANGHG